MRICKRTADMAKSHLSPPMKTALLINIWLKHFKTNQCLIKHISMFVCMFIYVYKPGCYCNAIKIRCCWTQLCLDTHIHTQRCVILSSRHIFEMWTSCQNMCRLQHAHKYKLLSLLNIMFPSQCIQAYCNAIFKFFFFWCLAARRWSEHPWIFFWWLRMKEISWKLKAFIFTLLVFFSCCAAL